MTKTLSDPTQPPGAIVETFADGGALRNDGVRLQPANSNPWYVLATVYGEQEGGKFDVALHEKNKREWNRLCVHVASGNARKACGFLKVSYDEYLHDGQPKIGLRLTNLLRERGLPDASNFEKSDQISFENLHFNYRLSLRGFYIPRPLRFALSTVSGRLDMTGCWFDGDLSVNGTHIAGPAMIMNAKTLGVIEIEESSVRNGLYMNDTEVQAGLDMDRLAVRRSMFLDRMSVSGDCEVAELTAKSLSMHNLKVALDLKLSGHVRNRFTLNGATISGQSEISQLYVDGDTDLSAATFERYFAAVGSRFSKSFRCEGATFNGPANFGPACLVSKANFNGTEFRNKTDFTGTYFLHNAPRFFQSQLHDDTRFPQSHDRYPAVTPLNASEDADAYGRLRHEAKKSERPDAEHFFLRKEMRCKEALADPFHGLFFKLYRGLSDYGFSVTRPLVGLLLTIAVGWPFMASFLKNGGETSGGAAIAEGLGISIANTFPFLGFARKMHPGFFTDAPAWLDALSGVQSFAGVILLFFLGLGLRNRFRLK